MPYNEPSKEQIALEAAHCYHDTLRHTLTCVTVISCFAIAGFVACYGFHSDIEKTQIQTPRRVEK